MSRPFNFMKLASLSLLAAGVLFLNSCSEDTVEPNPVENPQTKYEYTPMAYSGQTVRLLLTEELMKKINALDDAGAVAITKADLEAIFDNTNALFTEISTNKKLSDKISSLVTPNMVQQFRDWFDSIATRSTMHAGSVDAFTTSDGLYLPEMVEKTLMGAMMYHQAINYLTVSVPTADNQTIVEGEGTKMQHNWDEAFGYFGASRNYLELPYYAQRRTSSDVNGDGTIDPKSDRNFYVARYTATADSQYTTYTTATTSPKLGNAIMENFIAGRKAINDKNTAGLAAITAKILGAWDKMIAANAVRYSGVIKTRIASSANYNKEWAELKGFIDMTQYYNQNLLGVGKYAEVKALIGNKPSDVTTEKLDQIAQIVKTAYSF